MMGCVPAKTEPRKEAIASIKSAILIQRWYRRVLARMEVRRLCTWTIFQSLEYTGEQDQVELYNFFNALLTHMPTLSDPNLNQSQLSTEAIENEKDTIEISKSYAGPRLALPLGRRDIDSLIDLFRKRRGSELHMQFVSLILREATIHLKRLSNFNSVSTAISKQVTIIGDLHGKLDDLLVVLHKNGLPSTENPYVFNGDFVDRGHKGIEVFLLLLALFLVFPGAVHLNRGNHEDSVMNARYGFIREVQLKYPRNFDQILLLIDEVYRWLPLGSIINNRVLVVHGGLSDTTDLDLLKKLDRSDYISILRPPAQIPGNEVVNKRKWKQVFDIMWSDPHNTHGCQPNTLRGAGTYFGPDVTDAFLRKNKLKFLVRSHECKSEGYEFTHEEKVITIFSASNYYATGSNKGAYLKLNPQLDPYFVQYISAASRTYNLTFRQKVSLIELSALRELGARLRNRRDDLETEFRSFDPKETGYISVAQWCVSLGKITNLGLPWRLMRDSLAPVDGPPTKEVYYISTLELLDTDTIIEAHQQETSVADALYRNKSSLEAIFHIIDADNSGYITLDEFGVTCDLLAKYLPTIGRNRLLEMCQMMDINKDGAVDLNEFMEAFRLCDQEHRGSQLALAKQEKSRATARNTVAAQRFSQLKDEPNKDIDPHDHVARTMAPKSKKVAEAIRTSANR